MHMKKFHLPYHQSQITIELPDDQIVDVFGEKQVPVDPNPELSTDRALVHLAVEHYLPDHNRSTLSVAIAINDKTRPIPHQHLLPPLLRWLHNCGIFPNQITFYVATGTHQELTPKEILSILPGNIAHNYRVLSHNCDNINDLIYLGNTCCDTPVWINSQYYHSDLKIVVGNIEPHHFMGYSGGVKSVAIGLAGRETITTNHKMLLLPEAKAGNYDNNPMRMDIEEIGKMAGVHIALNVILNEEKQIITVLAGDPTSVMRKGIAIVQEQMMVNVAEPYDVVICSAGGFPKDINLYQSQKAMTHASYFARDGGKIILAAACSEGYGSKSFEELIALNGSSQEILGYFKEHPFQIGPHKALQIVKITQSLEVFLEI